MSSHPPLSSPTSPPTDPHSCRTQELGPETRHGAADEKDAWDDRSRDRRAHPAARGRRVGRGHRPLAGCGAAAARGGAGRSRLMVYLCRVLRERSISEVK
eukprot:scaffold40561_cov72-Phaeocystis_antarctica.AAC.7